MWWLWTQSARVHSFMVSSSDHLTYRLPINIPERKQESKKATWCNQFKNSLGFASKAQTNKGEFRCIHAIRCTHRHHPRHSSCLCGRTKGNLPFERAHDTVAPANLLGPNGNHASVVRPVGNYKQPSRGLRGWWKWKRQVMNEFWEELGRVKQTDGQADRQTGRQKT